MTLTESLVSSFILVALTTQTGRLFGDSMQALGKSRARDTVNAAIHRDLEDVRQQVALWKADSSMTTNGQLAYTPDAGQCQNATLGTALLNEESNTLNAISNLDLSQSPTPLQGLTVTRTISTANANNNLIQVNYSTTGSTTIKIQHSTTLSIPAQSWCPT